MHKYCGIWGLLHLGIEREDLLSVFLYFQPFKLLKSTPVKIVRNNCLILGHVGHKKRNYMLILKVFSFLTNHNLWTLKLKLVRNSSYLFIVFNHIQCYQKTLEVN